MNVAVSQSLIATLLNTYSFQASKEQSAMYHCLVTAAPSLVCAEVGRKVSKEMQLYLLPPPFLPPLEKIQKLK